MKNDIHFKIIIPMYNVEDWIETTIKSVKQQTYNNFQCVIVDDISTDSTVEIVQKLIQDDNRFILILNKEKKFALQNIIEATEISKPNLEDVIINLDGDDWFSNKDVLEYLNIIYKNEDCWLTYGNHYNYPNGESFYPLFKYPDKVINNNSYREFRFLCSHLRTYKYKLWKKINIQDLKDTEGKFYKTAWDLAYMIPMCEMAGNKAKFIEKYLYVYNNSNPNNDYKIYTEIQRNSENEIRKKTKYMLLGDL